MSIEKQQETATKVIERLQAIDPYVILAGGAPRDWHFGNEASDLDFYLHMTGVTINARRKQLEAAFGNIKLKWEPLCKHEDERYKTMKFLHSIWETEVDGIKVQIMNLVSSGDSFKVVEAMSCSICKAWWTPARGINLTTDFKITEKTKYMFLSEGYSWTAPHPSKMKAKFKNYVATTKEAAIDKVLREL